MSDRRYSYGDLARLLVPEAIGAENNGPKSMDEIYDFLENYGEEDVEDYIFIFSMALNANRYSCPADGWGRSCGISAYIKDLVEANEVIKDENNRYFLSERGMERLVEERERLREMGYNHVNSQ